MMHVKASVRGRMGLRSSSIKPRERSPPCLVVVARTTIAQLKMAENAKMRPSKRWRSTDLTSGSYAWVAGGTVGVARSASVEGSARIVVDDPRAADIVMDVEERTAGGEQLKAGPTKRVQA